MDPWMKFGTAALLVMMLIFLAPRLKPMIQNSPKGDSRDWMSALIPLALVIAFVVFLIKLV